MRHQRLVRTRDDPQRPVVGGGVADGDPHRGSLHRIADLKVEVVLVPVGGRADAAPIYSVELTGEVTLVTVRLGDDFVSIRADKDFTAGIDEQVNVRINPEKTFLFDSATEQRIPA